MCATFDYTGDTDAAPSWCCIMVARKEEQMRTLFLLLWILLSTPSVLLSAEANQKLSTSDFRVTLTEEPNSDLPLGEICTGASAQTLTCRAFTVRLENIGTHTVRINKKEDCVGAFIQIQERYPQGGSHTVSSANYEVCSKPGYAYQRLMPGESMNWTFRLAGPQRRGYAFTGGAHSLFARWQLDGCIEEPRGSDCVIPPIGWNAVFVESEAVAVVAPATPDFWRPSLSLEITAHAGKLPDERGDSPQSGCPEVTNTIDCIVFHYAVRNTGRVPVRNCQMSMPG